MPLKTTALVFCALIGTAHAQAVTINADDVPPSPIQGTTAVARVLLDSTPAVSRKASLTHLELPSRGRWQREGTAGMALAFVRWGEARVGAEMVKEGDVVLFPDGSARIISATLRTEILLVTIPPGAEAVYRTGAKLPSAEIGPPPIIYKKATAKTYPILNGKGEATLLAEGGPASVQHLRIAAGASVPEHVHGSEAEILWTTAGSGELTLDGRKYPIKSRTAIYIPPGIRHTFTASAEMNFQAIQFYTPAGPEQRFKKPATGTAPAPR